MVCPSCVLSSSYKDTGYTGLWPNLHPSGLVTSAKTLMSKVTFTRSGCEHIFFFFVGGCTVNHSIWYTYQHDSFPVGTRVHATINTDRSWEDLNYKLPFVCEGSVPSFKGLWTSKWADSQIKSG
jgi:hypothetical protein